MDRLALAISGEPCGKQIRAVEQPRVAGGGGEQHQLTNSDDATVMLGRAALDVAHLVGQPKATGFHHPLARATLDSVSNPTGSRGVCHGPVHPAVRRHAAFVYHCFDRIVIYGYLSGLSRPERVVNFFRQVVGVPVVSKEVLRQRTADYQNWVEAYARNHRIPIEWAEKGVRKEHHVLPWQRRMVRTDRYGVYCILKSMEQGPTFRVTVPKYPTKDPNYRILARQRSRFTHYYFYIRDETLGPMVMRVASFLPFQATYYLNGHSFIEQELNRAQIGFHKTDNASRGG